VRQLRPERPGVEAILAAQVAAVGEIDEYGPELSDLGE